MKKTRIFKGYILVNRQCNFTKKQLKFWQDSNKEKQYSNQRRKGNSKKQQQDEIRGRCKIRKKRKNGIVCNGTSCEYTYIKKKTTVKVGWFFKLIKDHFKSTKWKPLETMNDTINAFKWINRKFQGTSENVLIQGSSERKTF